MRSGEAGAAAPCREEARTAAGAHQATVDRRHMPAHSRWSPWRDVPERYGPWETIYGLFRRWQRDGTWHRIFDQLQARADTEGLITWDVSVGSTIARAHQHAAGARKRGSASRAARRCLRRARRPRARTLPGRADNQAPAGGRADPKADVTGDHRRAAGGLSAVPGGPGPYPMHGSGEVRPVRPPQEVRFPRWPTAEVRQDRLQRAARGGMRNQPPQRHRAVATRYDKLAVRYEATVLAAAINEWL